MKTTTYNRVLPAVPTAVIPTAPPGSGRQVNTRLCMAFLAAFICAATAVSSLAQGSGTYYRWDDERGRPVVSDRPPQDDSISYDVISPSTSLVRRVDPGEGAVPAEIKPRPGNEFEQVDTAQEELVVVRKNPEICARATGNLDTLNSTARIRLRDPDTGQLRYISEEEKEIQREKAREVMRAHCE